MKRCQEYLPLTRVQAVHCRESNEEGKVRVGSLDTVETQTHVAKDGHDVFSTVDKMWKDVLGVTITADALQGTPNRGQSGKEPQQTRLARVALCWVIPLVGVDTEKELYVLQNRLDSLGSGETWNRAYTYGICKRAVHVAEKEVAELNRIQAGKKETPLLEVSADQVFKPRMRARTCEYRNHFRLRCHSVGRGRKSSTTLKAIMMTG